MSDHVPEDLEEALVDLDGTIAGYEQSLRAKLAPLMSPGEPELSEADFRDPPPWIEARMDLVKSQPGFWRNLPRIEDGFRVLSLIVGAGFRTSILTKGPRKAKLAWTEKVEWCEENVPELRVTVGHDKGLVYGRLLFDDYPVYIQRWLRHRPRGVVLMLDGPINRDFEHPQVVRVMRPVTLEVESVVMGALERAKRR